MKASELMLGNFIYDEVNTRVGKVFRLNSGIDYPITYQYDKSFECTPNHTDWLKPIELTEDWLDCFGCKISGMYFFIGGQDHYYLTHGERGFWMMYVNHQIKYVHDLQNVFYALTGNKLEAARMPQL